MSVRELIGRAFTPPVRDARCAEAINLAHQARDAARTAAKIIESRDYKAARELRKAADRIGSTARRMWSL